MYETSIPVKNRNSLSSENNHRGVFQSTVKKKAFKVLLHLLNLYTLAIHYIGI